MKWPNRITLIRHDTSAYNLLGFQKQKDPLYRGFLENWERDPDSPETRNLALLVQEKFGFNFGDAQTPLADSEGDQAFQTGVRLRQEGELPDFIFVSPYKRAKETLRHIIRGWPELGSIRPYEEERIREQEHGLALLYCDWRIFHIFHPEQRRLYQMQGRYWYQFPQGESVPMVRDRLRLWMSTLTRDFSGKKVLAVTHHLAILAMRANFERLSAEEFLRLDEQEKPINCGVTVYKGYPKQGRNGRLKLEYYNRKYYD